MREGRTFSHASHSDAAPEERRRRAGIEPGVKRSELPDSRITNGSNPEGVTETASLERSGSCRRPFSGA